MDDGRRSDKSILSEMQKKYMRSLQRRPILTKSLTSGVVAFLANVTGQAIDKHRGLANEVELPPALRFAAFGFFISGPLLHYFYNYLLKCVPGKSGDAVIKRLLIERLILTPFYSLIFHSATAAMEHRSWDAVVLRLKAAYWLTLTMNWKYYTVAQIINLNFVPPEMRVLFGNFCGFLWSIALTSMKPKND